MENWKVYEENGVAKATAFSKCLRSTNQKMPHKIINRVMHTKKTLFVPPPSPLPPAGQIGLRTIEAEIS